MVNPVPHNPENKHGFIDELLRGQLMFFGVLLSKWKFNVGVLDEHEAIVQSREYRQECGRMGVRA